MTIVQSAKKIMWFAERRLANHVCPIFAVDKSGRPSLVGSGVLLMVATKHFLLTAAHVLDENKSSTIYYAGNNNLLELISENSYRTNAPSGKRADDKYDIACLELGEKYVAESSRYAFLSPRSIDPNDIPDTKKFYSYIGFPHSKTSVIPDLHKVKPKIYAYWSNSPAEETYESLGFTKRTHTLINFDKERVKTFDGQVQTFPNPWGMSGGAVWRLADLTRFHSLSFHPMLTGIAIEYHQKEKVLASTKIAFALESIRAKEPALSDHIPRCTIIKINIK